MLDVDHVISDLEVAKVRQKGGNFRFRSLRPQRDGFRFVEQIARSEDGKIRLWQQNAVWNVSRGQRGGKNLAGEVTGFVGIAFATAGARPQLERDVVLREDVGKPLDFANIGNCQKHAFAGGIELLYFLQHRRNRAVKAGRRLGNKLYDRLIRTACDAEVFDICAG